jgi:aryl carrier-like protein
MVEREDLLTRIATSLDRLGAPEEVVPEKIRPVAIQTKDRKDLSDLEKEMQKTLDSIKGDEQLPGILSRVATIHLRESSYARAIMLYEISLGLDSNQTMSWIDGWRGKGCNHMP